MLQSGVTYLQADSDSSAASEWGQERFAQQQPTASASSLDKVGLTHEAPLELEGFVNHFIGT